jgi:hypothetical protein
MFGRVEDDRNGIVPLGFLGGDTHRTVTSIKDLRAQRGVQ